jgi:3-phosphoshikimate 1-carboxyvinyltransferase
MGSCALLRQGRAVLTGDKQIQRRPSAPLAKSLNDLGARVTDLRGTGCAPFEVRGRLRGGETSLQAVSSQYLSSLLMSTPFADGESHIRVPLLNERPYVGITLDWLARQGIRLDAADDWSEFRVPGGQRFKPVDRRIPADFSSATFFLAAGALPGNSVACRGLDYKDTQGDKAAVEYLKAMGADVEIGTDEIRVTSRELRGCEIDLNATPDALPMMAVLACFAQGETRLVNVPQARQKETDRISVMHEELSKLGADVEELEDGLVVRGSQLVGTTVDSHDDHRIVMALAVGATQARGTTTIEHAEAMNVTYPAFAQSLRDLGGHAMELADTPQGTRA